MLWMRFWCRAMAVLRLSASQASYSSSRKSVLESHSGQTTARNYASSQPTTQFPSRPGSRGLRMRAGKNRVVLNLTRLAEIDTTGLGTLLFAVAKLRKEGGGLALVNLRSSQSNYSN